MPPIRLVTLSFKDCPQKPKCAGCYLERLKTKKPSRPTYGLPAQAQDIDSLIEADTMDHVVIQLNGPQDLEKIPPIGYGIKPDQVTVLMPITMLSDIAILTKIDNRLPKCKIAFTINLYMNEHTSFINRLANIVPIINSKYNIEFTITRDQVYNDRYSIQALLIMLRYLKMINKTYWDENHIFMNYIKTSGDTITIKDLQGILLLFDNDDINVIPSPCLQYAMGMTETPICEYLTLHEYLDGHYVNSGCPYGGRECQACQIPLS